MIDLHFAVPAWGVSIRGQRTEDAKHVKICLPNGAGKTTLLHTIRQRHPRSDLGKFLDSKTAPKELLAARTKGEIFEGFEPWTTTDYLLPGKFEVTSPSDFRDFIWLNWGRDVQVESETLSPAQAVELLRAPVRTLGARLRTFEGHKSWLEGHLETFHNNDDVRLNYQDVELIIEKLQNEADLSAMEIQRELDSIQRRQQLLKDAIVATHAEVVHQLQNDLVYVQTGIYWGVDLKAALTPDKQPRRFSKGYRQALKLGLMAAAALRLDGTVSILLDDEELSGTTEERLPEWPDNCRVLQVVPGGNTIEVIK